MNQKEAKEVWEERVNAYRQSHMSLPKWCKENDIRVSTMKYYVYQVHKKKSDETVSFVPATVIDVNTHSRSSSINVCINGASITVDQSTDLDFLNKVIKALL